MQVKEALAKARDLIKDPNRWTRNMYARDRTGNYASPNSPDAICWCAIGAVHHVFGTRPQTQSEMTDEQMKAFTALVNTATLMHDTLPDRVNDRLGHAAVLELFDRAIEACQ